MNERCSNVSAKLGYWCDRPEGHTGEHRAATPSGTVEWPANKTPSATEDPKAIVEAPLEPPPRQTPKDPNPKKLMGIRKLPILSVVSTTSILEEAKATRYGAYLAPKADGSTGYGPYNWRDQPIETMIYVDAILRHLLSFVDGEENAPDSKCHHLAHVKACCGILLDAMATGSLIDNRPKGGQAAQLIAEATQKEKP